MQVSAIQSFKVGNQLQANTLNNQYVSQVNKSDTVSFSGKYKINKVNVDYNRALEITNSLVSSTSGHRAVFGTPEFDADTIELLSLGVADYAKKVAKSKGKAPVVMVGGDTREASRKLISVVKDTLKNQGVNVVLVQKPVPTPLHAYMAKKRNYDISVLLTASHNPWEYGGFNLVTAQGAIAPNEITKKVAECALNFAKQGTYTIDKTNIGKVKVEYPYEMYKDRLDSYNIIDWAKIKKAGIDIYYDGLRGTGAIVVPKLMKDHGIKINNFVSAKQAGPEPSAANLIELSQKVADSKKTLKIGLANDGDADRYGIIDEKGQFIPANEILLLAAYHLHKHKGKTGAIIRSQATSSLIDIYAKQNNLPLIQTPVGFKFIGEDILALRRNGSDILVAGEESNGLTINGHIPEKDGMVAISLMLDLMAEENKPISQILAEVKKSLGVEYRIKSVNKLLSDAASKERVMNKIKQIYQNALLGKTELGDFEIDIVRTKQNMRLMEQYKKGGDGVKLYFTDGSSLLVRKSGTEPKIKSYIETSHKSASVAERNIEKLSNILDEITTV